MEEKKLKEKKAEEKKLFLVLTTQNEETQRLKKLKDLELKEEDRWPKILPTAMTSSIIMW